MKNIRTTIDPKRDLLLERIVDVPVELVWKAWTQPEHIKVWFCPRPWRVTACDIDLRPGGMFRTTMQGPNGESHSGNGCYLEIVERERLVWTDALETNYRPSSTQNTCFDGHFTAFVLMEPHGNGTRYTVIARHATEAAAKSHQEIGFADGWGTALDQLVEHMQSL